MGKFLVCDEPLSTENVTQYKVFGLGGGGFADPLITPADPGPTFGFKLDLTNLKPGTYSVRASALNEWQESPQSAPFEFSVPSAPSAPANLRIG